MDVQITTVSGVIMFKSVKFATSEIETTPISVPEPLIYSHLAVLHNMVTTSWTFRDRIPVGTRFFLVQTGPGAHPATVKWVAGLSRG